MMLNSFNIHFISHIITGPATSDISPSRTPNTDSALPDTIPGGADDDDDLDEDGLFSDFDMLEDIVSFFRGMKH